MCLDHVGQLTRSRGRRENITLLLVKDPWSKVDYSRHIREASMEMEGLPEVIPPSGRVSGQCLLAAPTLKWWRRWYREEIEKRTCILGISSAGGIYRRRAARGATRGPDAP